MSTFNRVYCVYRTHHPSGHYYIGKSSIDRIEAGYVGSGRRLHCAFLQPGFEPQTWTTEVLRTFELEADAYAHEAELVPLEILCDPFCLNDTPGGKGSFRGSPYALILRRNKKKHKANQELLKRALKGQKVSPRSKM